MRNAALFTTKYIGYSWSKK